MSKSDCGCGCGGASRTPSAFVRPRFFAGQLLTEDDLSLLVDYVAGKDRLHNRMVSGPGVVCGLEVTCDPCGGGTVAVHPGHALDCCGNDIVLNCKEKVDVAALVRELRVSSLGVDCGDPCDDDQRHYGLFVRYEESSIDPVAPYATEEPCPSPGCSPSRIQEGFRFVVKCDTADDHRYNPVSKLMAAIGPEAAYTDIRLLAQRLGLYLEPMAVTAVASSRPFLFNGEDQRRFADNLALLQKIDGPLSPPVAVAVTEQVRALSSAIARFDTYDEAGQADLLRDFPELDDVPQAREILGRVCGLLDQTNPEEVWPDPAHRAVALAVVAEAKARIANHDTNAPLEVRLLAQGTPIDNVLAVRFRSDLVRIREWLLGRLDRAPVVGDCTLRDTVRGAPVPQPLPIPEPDSAQRLTLVDLQQLVEAAGVLTTALRSFVTDATCSTLNPPCTDCTDTDVLLAHVELDGCDVVRICSATREQVLPGGSAYGEWLPKLFPLRERAQELCCQPRPVHPSPTVRAAGPVPTPYVAGLLDAWVRTGKVEELWDELLKRAPGETLPVHEQITVPAEVTDSLHELSALRTQVSELSATVTALRAQLDSARDQVSQVREQLPERLADRLSELESAPAPEPPAEEPKPEPPKPPARRGRSASPRTPRPKPGESS